MPLLGAFFGLGTPWAGPYNRLLAPKGESPCVWIHGPTFLGGFFLNRLLSKAPFFKKVSPVPPVETHIYIEKSEFSKPQNSKGYPFHTGQKLSKLDRFCKKFNSKVLYFQIVFGGRVFLFYLLLGLGPFGSLWSRY